MNERVTEKKKDLPQLGRVESFCLSDFWFLSVCKEDTKKEEKLFLFSQFLNLISFHLHLLGTGADTDKRPMMRNHVRHEPQEPPLPASSETFTGSFFPCQRIYLQMDCGYLTNHQHNNKPGAQGRASTPPLSLKDLSLAFSAPWDTTQ